MDFQIPNLARTLFEETGDALILFDPDTDQILAANPVAQKLCGFSMEDLLQMLATQLFHFGAKGGRQRLRHAAQKTQTFHAQEGFFLQTREAGVWIPVSITISRLHLQPKTLALITARDVRDRYEAYGHLAKAEAELRRVIASISDCLWSAELSPDGNWAYRFVSPVVQKITGRPPEYFVPSIHCWEKIVHPEDRLQWEKAVRGLRQGRPFNQEYRVVLPDGACRWIRESVQVDRLADERSLQVHGVITDISTRKLDEAALHQAEEKYRRIIEDATEGIFQSTPQGRFITANPALARMLGFVSAQAMIESVNDIAQQIHVEPERRREFKRALETVGVVHGFEAQAQRTDGTVIWISINARAVRDSSGTLLCFEGIVENISERKSAEKSLQARALQQAAVADLGQLALVVTDLTRVLTEATARVSETLEVASVAVWELKPAGKHLKLRAGRGWKEGMVGSLEIGVEENSPAGYTLLANEPVIVRDAASEDRFCIPDCLLEQGIQCGAAVIIEGMGGPFGVLSVFTEKRREFTEDDVHFLRAVANVLGAAIDRNQSEKARMRTEMEFRIAQQIQRNLFPEKAPSLRHFDIGGMSFPAVATGGDYFDYIPMTDGSIGIAIGDVTGHGFGPALLMAATRAYLRALAQTHTDVRQILKMANRVLVADTGGDSFITLLLARLEPESRTLVYASAGHLTGHILDAAGTPKLLLRSTGTPLGVEANALFDPAPSVVLEPGDIVVLLTDGVVEAASSDTRVFGIERALEVIRENRSSSAREIVDALYRAVGDFCQGAPQRDDVTAIIIKCKFMESPQIST